MINPSAINPFDLPFVPLKERSLLPATSCIYFAIDSKNVVQYIGQAASLRLRWANHHRYQQLKQIDGIVIAYVESPPQLLESVEAVLIEWFNPP